MTDQEARQRYLVGGGVVYKGHLYQIHGMNDDNNTYLITQLISGNVLKNIKASELVAEEEYNWNEDDGSQ